MSETGRILKLVVERADTPAGRVFDIGVQVLIILSLVSFTLETLPELTPFWRDVLQWFEVATVVLFTIEYTLRLLVADRKLAFVTSVSGLIDLLAIVPFYLPIAVDLRSIRVFRLFRLVRILKLLRYTDAIDHFGRAFARIREELVLYFIATSFVIYLSSVGIYYFESTSQPDQFGSVVHCLWWSIVTLTTVGYGDVYPITMGGRVFTTVVLMAGLGIVAVPSGLLASALTATDRQVESSKDD